MVFGLGDGELSASGTVASEGPVSSAPMALAISATAVKFETWRVSEVGPEFKCESRRVTADRKIKRSVPLGSAVAASGNTASDAS